MMTGSFVALRIRRSRNIIQTGKPTYTLYIYALSPWAQIQSQIFDLSDRYTWGLCNTGCPLRRFTLQIWIDRGLAMHHRPDNSKETGCMRAYSKLWPSCGCTMPRTRIIVLTAFLVKGLCSRYTQLISKNLISNSRLILNYWNCFRLSNGRRIICFGGKFSLLNTMKQ